MLFFFAIFYRNQTADKKAWEATKQNVHTYLHTWWSWASELKKKHHDKVSMDCRKRTRGYQAAWYKGGKGTAQSLKDIFSVMKHDERMWRFKQIEEILESTSLLPGNHATGWKNSNVRKWFDKMCSIYSVRLWTVRSVPSSHIIIIIVVVVVVFVVVMCTWSWLKDMTQYAACRESATQLARSSTLFCQGA